MLDELILQLHHATAHFEKPLINIIIEEFGHNPFLILIGCLLSLRARDTTTIHVCRELFTLVRTPQALLAIPRTELERIIFRTGFYKNKADIIQGVSAYLIKHHGGTVPQTQEKLMAIKGIGFKTTNLVLGLAFNKPAICVDTHVHRISNRLGIINTTTVEATEQALTKLLPPEQWIDWNYLLVMWGQNVCHPVSPKCSTCPIRAYCKRVGVKQSR